MCVRALKNQITFSVCSCACVGECKHNGNLFAFHFCWCSLLLKITARTRIIPRWAQCCAEIMTSFFWIQTRTLSYGIQSEPVYISNYSNFILSRSRLWFEKKIICGRGVGKMCQFSPHKVYYITKCIVATHFRTVRWAFACRFIRFFGMKWLTFIDTWLWMGHFAKCLNFSARRWVFFKQM